MSFWTQFKTGEDTQPVQQWANLPTDPTAALPAGIGSSAEIAQANKWLGMQPWYRQMMQSFGQNPAEVHLTDPQRAQLLDEARKRGVGISDRFTIDPSGNINTHHGWAGLNPWLKALAIAGAGAGAVFAAPAIGAALGGAGGAGGGAGAAGGAAAAGGGVLPSTVIGTGMLTAAPTSVSSGLLAGGIGAGAAEAAGAAGAGAAGTGAGTTASVLPSTQIGTGMQSSAPGLAPSGAMGGGSIWGKVATMGKDYLNKQGVGGIVKTAGKIAGGLEAGREAGRKRGADNAKTAQTYGSNAYDLALRSALAKNMTDFTVTPPPGVHMATTSGGPRPSAIGPEGKVAANEMNNQAMRQLLSAGKYTLPDDLNGNALDTVLGTASTVGSALGGIQDEQQQQEQQSWIQKMLAAFGGA